MFTVDEVPLVTVKVWMGEVAPGAKEPKSAVAGEIDTAAGWKNSMLEPESAAATPSPPAVAKFPTANEYMVPTSLENDRLA